MHPRRRKYLWQHSITIYLFILLYKCVIASQKQFPQLQNIHKSMKKRDLSRIFGEEDVNKVPHYQIIQPRIHTKYINKNIGRRKRDITNNKYDHPKDFKFDINAYNKAYRFNMSINADLLGPNFKIEVKRKNGTFVKRDIEYCYYHGNLHGEKYSSAAVSTCNGLSGMFTSKQHDYFIEPVPSYLLKSDSEYLTDYHKPHVVYRRSLEEHNSPSEIFHNYWSKGNNARKQSCATSKNPFVRYERSADDISNLVKSDNSEKYIESLIVVDQKMVNYHGEDAATQFALAVLNIVGSLLRDGSIGANLIILVVVKLELHTVDIPGLVINHHARNTLESFGTWASRASDQDDRSDDHYDYAILLTRYNICADDRQPCDTLGLTQTGGMCNWPDSASINEDNGLPLAYTITHSIGHSLGMNHDGDESSFICPDDTYIMSSSQPDEWKDTRNLWSRCSRNYLRQFLKKPQSHCLNDLPVKSRAVDYEKLDNKPGILYDINKQCAMQFGTGSKICSKDKIELVCEKLSCTDPANPDKCFKSSYPAADGTSCALNKWCYRGKCMSVGQTTAVDGGWSSWSDDFTACSRSCGGGVQYRFRQCSHPKPSNGGKYCEGDARRYRLCNNKPCPSGLTSHRHAQCSKLDNRLFGERKFTWEFKPSKIDSCKLGCFISNTGHGYDFGNVEDGTNCDQMDGSVISDKCINGECISVGCDGVLGSEKKFDRCGVCNGDGSSCATGSDRSEIPDVNQGTGGIADALKSLKDLGFDMGSLYGRSELSLNGKRSGIPGTDGEFGWARVKSGCSVSCGGGSETVTAECRRQDDGSPVNEERCDKNLKPPVQRFPCKDDACPPVWQTSYWGDCSRTCNGGLKKRNVRCVQKSGTGIEYDVDGSLCVGSRPSDTEGCNKEPCPSEWISQPFGECSTICGPGVQVRDVLCQKTLKDGTLLTQKEGDCRKETKPPTEQKCNVHNPCPGDDGCGGIYTDDKGNFTSPQYPNNYPNNMECVHIIQVQEGKAVQLDFESMKIVAADEKDCKNDFVKVMDGDCVSRLGESKFCGKSIPPPFISTTNRLCVKFFSDDSQNDEGFVAKYRSIDKPVQVTDLCGANITAPAGLISSPNYPEYYPPNEDCNITISTEEKPIKINFHAFDVGTDDCSNDFVFLSGGDESKKYCGQKVPPMYVSTANPVILRFVSTNHPANMKAGFVATYTSGSGSSDDTQKSSSASSNKSSSSSPIVASPIAAPLAIPISNASNAKPKAAGAIPFARDNTAVTVNANGVSTVMAINSATPMNTAPVAASTQPVAATQAVVPNTQQALNPQQNTPLDKTTLSIKRNGTDDETRFSEYKKDSIYQPPLVQSANQFQQSLFTNPLPKQQYQQEAPALAVDSNSIERGLFNQQVKSYVPQANIEQQLMQAEPQQPEHLQAAITTDPQAQPIPVTTETQATITNPQSTFIQNTGASQVSNEAPKVSFVNVGGPTDEIAKEVQLDANIRSKESPEERKLFDEAMKDDTPAWVPEPVLITENMASPLEGPPRTDTESSIEGPPRTDTEMEKKTEIPKAVKKHIPLPATNIISLPTFMPNEKKSTIPERLHKAAMAAPPSNNQASVTSIKAAKPLITHSSVVRPFQNKQNIKKPISVKKFNLIPSSNYQHNLDGSQGACPSPVELKCLRVLLSYPCSNDYHCKAGFSCCRTSCEYGIKMCTPKVTRHCPLRDPFYYPHIPCNSELECPNKSPCCLDMTNKRYCRHMLVNRWVQ